MWGKCDYILGSLAAGVAGIALLLLALNVGGEFDVATTAAENSESAADVLALAIEVSRESDNHDSVVHFEHGDHDHVVVVASAIASDVPTVLATESGAIHYDGFVKMELSRISVTSGAFLLNPTPPPRSA